MSQAALSAARFASEGRKFVVSYGGGVNSVAVLVRLAQLGIKPTAIVMADPGAERAKTVVFRDKILPTWLAAQGFPLVETITRIAEGRHVRRAWRLETLYGECIRLGSLPSVAYGWKKCSAKYKGDTQRWWAKRQPFAQAEWAAGRKLVKVIGYDAGEQRRVIKAFQNPWENARFEPWYPLVESGMDRDDCQSLIRDAGLPLPVKSACTFCPNNTLAEWEEVRRTDPGAFAAAVKMSRKAEAGLESPEVVGLMRCNPHGKRQLHVWADGGYPELQPSRYDDEDAADAQPCECAL